MGKLKEWFMNVLFKAYIGKVIAFVFEKAKGNKTQLASVLIFLIHMAKNLGYLPDGSEEIAEQVLNILYGIGGVAFGDKIRRWYDAFKKSADAVVSK